MDAHDYHELLYKIRKDGDTGTGCSMVDVEKLIDHTNELRTKDPVLQKDITVDANKVIMKALPDNRGTDQPEHADYLARGGVPYETFRCPDWLYPLVLIGKLHEEVEEVREAMNDPREYADVIIVLSSLAYINGVNKDAINAAVDGRRDMKGAFTLGKILRRKA